ncbi:hypothetical protein [Rhodococcus artemisiae]|uniref:Uncharacterized protein n=1 Tax=Rhodococcus artemisiae TaxID=714159 RepID=A0ABU7LAE2_9NOCA|nr:hypothetical protein [Rhodococcus artemisiae]MEE2058526.1 hypothetical protein [Rhodococcus artemisiae]
MIKTGTRLESQVCDTQVIVVSATGSLDEIRCGGVGMVVLGSAKEAGVVLDEAFTEGPALGKRYVTEDGAEVLVTKAGRGALSVGATVLTLKEPKALPASD